MNIRESELFYTVSLCSLVLAQQINLDGVNRGCFIDCVIHPICPCVYLGSGSSYQGGVLCEKKGGKCSYPPWVVSSMKRNGGGL